jgi:RNA polymerase sigma-70 factor (ECF subfamily)
MSASEDIHLELPRTGAIRKASADESLEQLFRTQYPRLLNLLTRLTSDRARAEELASEVFCKLARRPALFRPSNNLEGWLYRTAMNLGLDSLKMDLRRRKNERAAAVDSTTVPRAADGPLNELLRAEQRRKVRRVLGALKPESARALILHHAGFSYREIARVMELNPLSVGKLILRSRVEFERRFRMLYEARP